MTLSGFPLLADENIHADAVAFLSAAGFDIVGVRESSLLGATDAEILKKATEEGRVVVTHDRDFGGLAIAALQPLVGILYLRPGHIDPAFTIDSLKTLLSQSLPLHRPFVLVVEQKSGQVRIRLRTL